MKAYLFIETGEERCPERGEYFINVFGSCSRRGEVPIGTRCILTHHEIEIPYGANNMTVAFQNINGCLRGSISHVEIPIPRPKKKVKKTVEVSLYKDASARWKIPASIDTDKLPNYLGTFTVEIEVEE